MDKGQNLLYREQWKIIDQTDPGLNMEAIKSFATDDLLCASVGAYLAPATARFWIHRPTVVLGIQDSKLPYLSDGLAYLSEEGYQYFIRNSGGLAVVLDEGILNVTLVFPESEKGMDIKSGYDAMYLLVKQMFSGFTKDIEAKEIMGSYCPGSYDLSINGKKFAGISQRRLKKGAAVQAYLCITGSGSERARIVKQFYSLAKKNAATTIRYPEIDISLMASISELLNENVTIEKAKHLLIRTLEKNCHHIFFGSLTENEINMFPYFYKRILERNAKIF